MKVNSTMSTIMTAVDGVPTPYFLRTAMSDLKLNHAFFDSPDEFYAGYCLDAPQWMPSGSVVNVRDVTNGRQHNVIMNITKRQ